MKKRLQFVSCLLCVMLLLCACNGRIPSETVPTTAPAQSKETTAPTDSPEIQTPILPPYEPDESKYEVVPLEKKDFALAYDRRCNMDVYFSHVPASYPITILSRTEVDTDTIRVSMEGELDYQVAVYPQSLDLDPQLIRGSNIDYNTYVYQTQRGLDWKTAGDLFRAYTEASLIYEADRTGENFDASFAAQKAFDAYMEQYLQGYEQERESYIEAVLYVYVVDVRFTACDTEQVINCISLEVEGQTYDLDVGEIRLHPPEVQLFEGAEPNWNAMEEEFPPGEVHHDDRLWSDGHGYTVGSFLAMDDLTLTGLEFAGTKTMTATSIRITRTTEQGQTMESVWDGVSPFYVDKGDKIEMYIEYYDPGLEGRAVCCSMVCIGIRFHCQGIESVWSGYLQDAGVCNSFNLAAVYLDGLDLRSYYLYFYNQREFYNRSGA